MAPIGDDLESPPPPLAPLLEEGEEPPLSGGYGEVPTPPLVEPINPEPDHVPVVVSRLLKVGDSLL